MQVFERQRPGCPQHDAQAPAAATSISFVTYATPSILPKMNSLGDRSVTSNRSSEPPSRSFVIDVTARALTITRLTKEQEPERPGGDRNDRFAAPGHRRRRFGSRNRRRRWPAQTAAIDEANHDHLAAVGPGTHLPPQHRVVPDLAALLVDRPHAGIDVARTRRFRGGSQDRSTKIQLWIGQFLVLGSWILALSSAAGGS